MPTALNHFLVPIRPTVRAVILRNGHLLVQTKQKPGGAPYLTLPGGKQDAGETMEQSVQRECMEEISANVTVGRLLHVAEVFKPREDGLRHQVEMLFACDLPEGYQPRMGHHPDPSQTGTIWANPADGSQPFRPDFARHLLQTDTPVYLGVFDG